jgi:hypothetical protein
MDNFFYEVHVYTLNPCYEGQLVIISKNTKLSTEKLPFKKLIKVKTENQDMPYVEILSEYEV